jgi:hypothetical protein
MTTRFLLGDWAEAHCAKGDKAMTALAAAVF